MPILVNLELSTYLVCIGLVTRIGAISLNEKYIKHPDQVAYIGQATTLLCHAENLAQPVNWWFRSSPSSEVIEICVNGLLLNGNAKKFDLDTEIYSMTLKNATSADSGTYTCAENNGFDTRHVTQLTVKEPECNHGNQTFVTGQQVTIHCNATTRDPVNWLYQRLPGDMEIEISVNGKFLNGNSKRFSLNDHNSDLTVSNPSLADAGKYTCVEDSGFGKRHSTRLVNVVQKTSESSTASLTNQPDPSRAEANMPELFYIVIIVVLFVLVVLLIFVLFVLHLRGRCWTSESVVESHRRSETDRQASEPLMIGVQSEEGKRKSSRFSVNAVMVPEGQVPTAGRSANGTSSRSRHRSSLLNSDATLTWPQCNFVAHGYSYGKRIGDFAQRFNEFVTQLTTTRSKKETRPRDVRDVDFSPQSTGNEPHQ